MMQTQRLSPSKLQQLQEGLHEMGLSLTGVQEQRLMDYLSLMVKWNKVYNLTAIRKEEDMLTHHLLDSLAVVGPLQKYVSGTQAAGPRILDVGAGAGLPGVVIAICCPHASVICVDAVGKKAAFISQVAATLGLANLRGLHARVEEMLPGDVQQGFDVITSRAFASLLDFTSLTALHLSKYGVWMAMKAKAVDVEAAQLPKGVGVFHVEPLTVPFLHEERCLVWMQHQSQHRV